MEKEEEFPERKEPVYEKQLPDYAVEYPKGPPSFQAKEKALILQTNSDLESVTPEMAQEIENLILFFPMNYSDREEHLDPENLFKFGKKLPLFTNIKNLQLNVAKQDHKCPIYNVVKCNLKIEHMASQHCEDFLLDCINMKEEQLDQLKSFGMFVDYIYLSKNYFVHLSKFLGKAKNISKLHLSFKNSKLSNDMLEIMADGLSQTLNYEDLYLNLDYNDDLKSELENDTFIQPQFEKIILKNVNMNSCHICMANTRHLPVEFLYPIMEELKNKGTHKNLINYNIDFGNNAGKCNEYFDKQEIFQKESLRARKGKLYQVYAFFQKRMLDQKIISRHEIINDFAELL